MKLLISLVIALMWFSPVIAQRQTVEELNKKLNDSHLEDIERIKTMNELAKRNSITPGLRDSLLNASIQLSRKANYLAGEAMALSIKAENIHVNLSDSIARVAIQLAERSGDKEAQFWAYRQLGQTRLNGAQSATSIDMFRKALKIAEELKNPHLVIFANVCFVDYYKAIETNYPEALQWALKSLHIAEQYKDIEDLALCYENIGRIYLLVGDKDNSYSYLQRALDEYRKTGNKYDLQFALNDMGEHYRIFGNYPEALKVYSEAALIIKDTFNMELNQSNIADVYQRMGNDAACMRYAHSSLRLAVYLDDKVGLAWIANILSRAYLHLGKKDSALFYAEEGYKNAVIAEAMEYKRDNSEALANAWLAKGNYEKALRHYKSYISVRDSMLTNEIATKANLALYNYDLEKKQSEISLLKKDKDLQQAVVLRQQYLLIGFIAILLVIIISLFFLYRSNIKRKRANTLLQEQKLELQVQRDQTARTLNELRQAQRQLVQTEKMASLGELTAGIAHEIKNPLNFVNNFSVLSSEMIDEMIAEINKGNFSDAQALASDVKQNLQKIVYHGTRADAIVKGMLLHSRSSSGQLEPTAINALCDEYLRLSYHGLRAKDKTFNTLIKTDFDESIDKINIIPQDIGRVLLNLITNAFYAVNEKNKKNIDAYQPVVTISTKRLKNKIEIRVNDNGDGIPADIKEKIFQPFFTTKPSGEGTGLGLSLSYDIVKAHGGELHAESTIDVGTSMVITLPV